MLFTRNMLGLLIARAYGLPVIFGTVLLSHCSEEMDRFERVEKLRTVGVQANSTLGGPFVALSSSETRSVDLTLVVALPEGQVISETQPYEDPSLVDSGISLAGIPIGRSFDFGGDIGTLTVEIDIDPNYVQVDTTGPLDLYEIAATVTFPVRPAVLPEELVELINSTGIRFRYGVSVLAGGERENIIGDIFWINPSATDNQAVACVGNNPRLTAVTPASGSVLPAGDIDLSATVEGNTCGERLKVIWFTSQGEVENPRKLTTTWKETNAGAAQVIVALLPQTSRRFSYQVLDLTLN